MITPFPPAPSRADPANFPVKADAWVEHMDQFTTEANALQVDVNAKQVLAASSAAIAVDAANVIENYAGKRYLFNATEGQLVFTLPDGDVYTAGNDSLYVYEDGLLLEEGLDYTETSTSTFTLTAGANVGSQYSVVLARITNGTGAQAASAVTVTPSGGISSLNVQSALVELDSEKVGVAALAASGGSALVGFIAAGTGAVDRTVQSKSREVVSLDDFGGSPAASAATNDAAFAAVFNELGTDGGIVTLPQGDINISATVTPPFNVSLRGQGVRATLLRMNTLNQPAITLAAGFITLSDFGILYAGTPVSGAIAINVPNADNYITNIKIFNAYDGIKYTASGQKASAITIQDCVNTGIFCDSCADVYVDNFLITTPSGSPNFANGGIRLTNKAEAILLNNGSVLGGKYSFVTGADSYAQDVRPAYNHFVNVFFDSGSEGVFLDKLAATKFVACWFSGGRSGGGFPGMHLGQSNSVTFESCQFFNCGSHGAFIDTLASGFSFRGCLFADNSVSVAANGGRGLLISSGVSDFIVQGCQATNGLFSSGNQGFGIVVDTGASDRYIVVNNLVSGNVIDGVFDGGTGVNKTVGGNW